MLVPTFVLALLLPGALASEVSDSDRLPAFALENFDGRVFSNESFTGKTTLVVPTYAKCIFACPMITFFLTELDKELGSPTDLQYVHVSVQPSEDTAEEILEHFEDHSIDATADPRWMFVNGPETEVAEFLTGADVHVTRTQVDEGVLIEHTTRIFVVGPDGETLATFDSYFWDEKEMRHALRYAIQ